MNKYKYVEEEIVKDGYISSVIRYYDSISSEYEEVHIIPWMDSFLKVEEDIIVRIISSSSNVLDLGCGSGRHLINLSRKCNVIGVDISKQMLIRLKKKCTVQVILSNIINIPFKNETFNVVLLTYNTYGHIPRVSLRQKVLFEIKRVLKNKGLLILSVWLEDALNYWEKLPGYKIYYCRDENNSVIVSNKKSPLHYVHTFTISEVKENINQHFEINSIIYIDRDGNISDIYRKGDDYMFLTCLKREEEFGIYC